MIGRPILIDEDEHITHMSVAVLNYYQDAEHHMDQLEDALAACKRDNEHYHTEIEQLKDEKATKATNNQG